VFSSKLSRIGCGKILAVGHVAGPEHDLIRALRAGHRLTCAVFAPSMNTIDVPRSASATTVAMPTRTSPTQEEAEVRSWNSRSVSAPGETPSSSRNALTQMLYWRLTNCCLCSAA
jgi:hypothetical protein